MNMQQLRQSLKLKWVSYYDQNRSWLVKMRIWGTYDGIRRPSSGFILATLSVLEPEINDNFPFILELNNNPDQIVAALGLNFNPEEHLHLVQPLDAVTDPRPTESQLETFHSDKSFASGIFATSVESTIAPLAVFNDYDNTPVVAAIALKNEVESKPLTSVAVAIEVESKEKVMKLHQKDAPPESNVSPVNKARSLANWIDDFCQGIGWDREGCSFYTILTKKSSKTRSPTSLRSRGSGSES